MNLKLQYLLLLCVTGSPLFAQQSTNSTPEDTAKVLKELTVYGQKRQIAFIAIGVKF